MINSEHSEAAKRILTEEDEYLSSNFNDKYFFSPSPKASKNAKINGKSNFFIPWVGAKEKTKRDFFKKNSKNKLSKIHEESPFYQKDYTRLDKQTFITARKSENHHINKSHRLPNMISPQKTKRKGIKKFTPTKKVNMNQLFRENLANSGQSRFVRIASLNQKKMKNDDSGYLKSSKAVSELRRFNQLESKKLTRFLSDEKLKKVIEKNKRVKKESPMQALAKILGKNYEFNDSHFERTKSEIKAKIYEKIGKEVDKMALDVSKSKKRLKKSLRKNREILFKNPVYDIKKILLRNKAGRERKRENFMRLKTEGAEKASKAHKSFVKKFNLFSSRCRSLEKVKVNHSKRNDILKSGRKRKCKKSPRAGKKENLPLKIFEKGNKRKKSLKKKGILNSSNDVTKRLIMEKKKIKFNWGIKPSSAAKHYIGYLST